MKPDDLIAFIIEEAQHCVISDKCSKNATSALVAHAKRVKEKLAKRRSMISPVKHILKVLAKTVVNLDM